MTGSSNRVIRKAYELAARGNVDGALMTLRSAQSADPGGSRSEALGMILYQAGRWKEAAEALMLAAQSRRHDPQLMFYLASALSRGGDMEKALRLLEEAANARHKDVAPLAARCLILIEQNDIPAARVAYESARTRFIEHTHQDSYSIGLLDQCAEALQGLPRETPAK